MIDCFLRDLGSIIYFIIKIRIVHNVLIIGSNHHHQNRQPTDGHTIKFEEKTAQKARAIDPV